MFTKAVDWEMVEEETLKRVRKVKQLPENNQRLRYLSKEQCNELLNACEAHLRPIVVTALNTGMRKGETLKLKWDNVDLKHGFILLELTKNGHRREIPINTTLRVLLKSIFTSRRIDVPYVFYNQKKLTPYRNVRRSFRSGLEKLDRDISDKAALNYNTGYQVLRDLEKTPYRANGEAEIRKLT